MLSTDQDVIISGLSGNLIYDIPTFIGGSAVPANGTAFTVGCQLVPGGSQAGDFDAVNSAFPIHVHDELMNINVTPRRSRQSLLLTQSLRFYSSSEDDERSTGSLAEFFSRNCATSRATASLYPTYHRPNGVEWEPRHHSERDPRPKNLYAFLRLR